MILCKKCGMASQDARITGPVLIAIGTVEIDDVGNICAISPLRATQTIQIGTELQHLDNFLITCKHCDYSDRIDAFSICGSCVLTQTAVSYKSMTAFGEMFVIPELEQELLQIFSVENADWRSTIDMETL